MLLWKQALWNNGLLHGDSNSNKWLEQRSRTAKHVAVLHVVYNNTGRTTSVYISYFIYYFSCILSTQCIYEWQLFLNFTSRSAIYHNQVLLSYRLSIQSFEDVHTRVYGVMYQKAIIMRRGFTSLEGRRVGFICRSTCIPRLKNRIRYEHLVVRQNMKLRGKYTLLRVQQKFK